LKFKPSKRLREIKKEKILNKADKREDSEAQRGKREAPR
jgi:hypothetical protein